MSHVRRADWAANVPWDGILDKPAGLGGDTDIGQLKGAGFSIDDVPVWNGTKFVPAPYNPGGGSGDIKDLNTPGVATKRFNPGTGDVENVWLQEVFDLRQYGADNTGGIDCTANLNSAITALNAVGGGALIIPAGRYTIGGSLNRILGRCWIHGDGEGSTILTFSGDAWWVTSGSFFGCTGMTLIGSSAAATGVKIMDSANRDNFLLTDLRITGFGYSISVDTVNRAGWVERVRLEALNLALSLNASDSFVRGISIYNGGDNTKNAFEMTGYRNQVSDFKLLGDAAHFLKGLFVNDGGNHIISGGIIIGCDEEAISLSNGTGGVSGCRVQNISWLDIGTDPDVVSYDSATNYVNDLYEIGTGTPVTDNVVLVPAPATILDPGANNQVANDGSFFYSYKDTQWYRTPIGPWGGTVVASGGTVTTDGFYTIHTFTSNGSFVVTTGGQIDYLLVGGGGGGGGFGGGGGGGWKKLLAQTIGVASFPVVIGAGGAQAGSGSTKGSDGSVTTFNGDSADGGGGGGAFSDSNSTGNNGGSGGGGGTDSTSPFTGRPGGTGTVGEGNDGGAGVTGATAGGGGGGGGAAGTAGSGTTGGAGGAGHTDSISGAAITYGPGGGGGGQLTGGAGGTGGGGGGGAYNGGTGPAATPATGIGAGGGASYAGLFGTPTDGTDGIVVIRYLTP